MTYFSPSSRVHIDLAGLTASDVHVLKKFAPRVTMQNSIFCGRPRVWNGLPRELCLLPRSCTNTFYAHLKTYPFVRAGVGSAF